MLHTSPQALRPPTIFAHPPTNNTTILLPILTDKKSASLEFLIDSINLKIEFQQIYPTHCQPKNSELTVQPSLKLSTTRYKSCQWFSYHEQVNLTLS